MVAWPHTRSITGLFYAKTNTAYRGWMFKIHNTTDGYKSSVIKWLYITIAFIGQLIELQLINCWVITSFYSGRKAPSLKMQLVWGFFRRRRRSFIIFLNFSQYGVNADWFAASWHVLCCLTHCLMADSIVGLVSKKGLWLVHTLRINGKPKCEIKRNIYHNYYLHDIQLESHVAFLWKAEMKRLCT